LISPLATISIHDGRGKCVDPPVESFGRISLVKTVASGTGNDGETDTLTARFPSGPGIERPSSQIILGCCFYNDLNPTPVSRACPLPGNADLSAGLITVQGNGTTINAEPQPSVQGTTYQQALPSGFIAPGQYQFSASGGPVQFNGELLVGPPIQIQTSLSPGTMISDTESFTITWTGGQPGTLVKASLSTPAGIYAAFDYAYVDATDGSFSFVPYCTDEGATQMYCTYTIGTSNNAQVVIEVFPSPDEVNEITAQGLTDGIKMSWMYRYIFGGLILN